jgi:hypothetical protein
MTGRRVLGALLIALSLVGFVAAVLDLAAVSHADPPGLGLPRWAPVFWLGAGCLILAALVSPPRDKVGNGLGRVSLCLLAAHLSLPYLAVGSGAAQLVLAAIAFAFSVFVTILGWHLLLARARIGGRVV